MVGTVLLIIVCVFILCHSLKFVINMLELWAVVAGKDPSEVWNHKMNIMVAFSHLLIVINCSVNFIIYCWKVRKSYSTKYHSESNLGFKVPKSPVEKAWLLPAPEKYPDLPGRVPPVSIA